MTLSRTTLMGLMGALCSLVLVGGCILIVGTLTGRFEAEQVTAIVSIVSGIAALAVAGSALNAFRQWSDDQVWKRREWMRQFTKSFQDTPGARNACLILATDGRQIPIFDDEEPDNRYRPITWDQVVEALLPASIKPVSVDPLHSAIRDSFDDFLGRLASLEFTLKAERLEKEDIRPALHQWIRIIGHEDKDQPHIRALRLYIDRYEHRAVQEVFLRFGVDLTSSLEDDRLSFLQE